MHVCSKVQLYPCCYNNFLFLLKVVIRVAPPPSLAREEEREESEVLIEYELCTTPSSLRATGTYMSMCTQVALLFCWD